MMLLLLDPQNALIHQIKAIRIDCASNVYNLFVIERARFSSFAGLQHLNAMLYVVLASGHIERFHQRRLPYGDGALRPPRAWRTENFFDRASPGNDTLERQLTLTRRVRSVPPPGRRGPPRYYGY